MKLSKRRRALPQSWRRRPREAARAPRRSMARASSCRARQFPTVSREIKSFFDTLLLPAPRQSSAMRQASRALLGACSRRRGLSSTAGEEGSLVWSQLQHEAQAALKTPAFSRFGMGKFLEREVLARASLADALSRTCAAPSSRRTTPRRTCGPRSCCGTRSPPIRRCRTRRPRI